LDEALRCKKEWICGMGELLELREKNDGAVKHFVRKLKMRKKNNTNK
jgi:hypothetical protein